MDTQKVNAIELDTERYKAPLVKRVQYLEDEVETLKAKVQTLQTIVAGLTPTEVIQ